MSLFLFGIFQEEISKTFFLGFVIILPYFQLPMVSFDSRKFKLCLKQLQKLNFNC